MQQEREKDTPKETIMDVRQYREIERAIQRDEEEPDPKALVPALSDADIANAEKAVTNLVRAQQISLRATNKNDWVDMGGKPYLQESGVMKVARVWGVEFRDLKVAVVNEVIGGQPVIRYVAYVTAYHMGREVPEMGVAGTDDSFFGRKNDQPLPLDDVDKDSVRKKALTNAQSRAVKKILGLGGITWDEVNAATEGRGGTIAKVNYTESKAKREGKSDQSDPRAKLLRYCEDIASWDECSVDELIEGFSQFHGKDGKMLAIKGRQGLARASDNWAKKAADAAEKAWREHPAQGGGTEEREAGQEG